MPICTDSGPGRSTPAPNGPGRLIAGAGGDGHAGGGRPGHLRRLEHAGQPDAVDLEDVEDLIRPAPRGNVEEQRPGCVGHVDRTLAAEAEPHVVLRQEHVGDARVHVRLVPAKPEELRSREAGQGAVARKRDEALEPHSLLDLGALGASALVVPEDRRPQRAQTGVEADEPVHLAGQPDRGDRAAAQRGQRPLAGTPPVLRVLLGPPWPRGRERVLLDGLPQHLAGRCHGDRLDSGRADVQADQHGRHDGVL